MREFQEFFGKLYFSESVLGRGRIEDGELIIPISGLFVLSGHPLQDEGNGPYTGELVFVGVLDSRKTVKEYIGDSRKPEGFKAPREVIDDIPVSHHLSPTQQYGFEGYQEEPSAWVDNWLIQARLFKFRIL